jgi:hypothetical protein
MAAVRVWEEIEARRSAMSLLSDERSLAEWSFRIAGRPSFRRLELVGGNTEGEDFPFVSELIIGRAGGPGPPASLRRARRFVALDQHPRR